VAKGKKRKLKIKIGARTTRKNKPVAPAVYVGDYFTI